MKPEKVVPFSVEQSLRQLGSNLRIARTRRNISSREMAERIGVHRTLIGDAERGKPGTAISVYMSILWVLDLMGDFETIADPNQDSVGLTLARTEERQRASTPRELDNDF